MINKLKIMYAIDSTSGGTKIDTEKMAEDLKIIEDNVSYILTEAENPFVNNNYTGTNSDNIDSLVYEINKTLNNMIEPLNSIKNNVDLIKSEYNIKIQNVGNVSINGNKN